MTHSKARSVGRFGGSLLAPGICVLLLWGSTSWAADTPAAASSVAAPAAAGSPAAPAPAAPSLDQLLDMAEHDPGQLTQLPVQTQSGEQAAPLGSPSSSLNTAEINSAEATTTGDLLRELPSVYGRRTSGVSIDPRIRGYNSSELNGSANGVTQYKTIQDVDSLFSQIDPGNIQEIHTVDGPYTSLYGPGFAFITADLVSPRRYDQPETHVSTVFNYDSNGQGFYSRENVWTGSNNWGAFISYGVRGGNDYHPGGAEYDFVIPAQYQRWDGMASLSYDLSRSTRIECDLLHTEYNNVDLPGIIYDLNNSTNNQFNVRYIVQEDRNGPQQLLIQAWHQETFFNGDSSKAYKFDTFYYPFITLPVQYDDGTTPVLAIAQGHLTSTGVRAFRTFGDADSPQWTIGLDWRRVEQRYLERDVDADGNEVYSGNYFGVPESSQDDEGVFTNLLLPVGNRLTFTFGGRVDYTKSSVDLNDSVVTHFDPGTPAEDMYYQPSTDGPAFTLGMAYAMAKWKMTDHDVLNAGTGFAMRGPSLSELYSDEPYVPIAGFGNSFLEGNSTLKPERDWQVDLGITSAHGPFRYGARGFYATMWDYIMPTPAYICATAGTPTNVLDRNFWAFPSDWREDLLNGTTNADTSMAGYQMGNIQLATLGGGNLFGEVQVCKGLSVFGCMSYIHGENLSRVQFVDSSYNDSVKGGNFVRLGGTESLPDIYPFNGRIAVRVCDPDKGKWGVEFIARLVHSQDEVAWSIGQLPSPGFTVYDLKGYYCWSKNLRLTLALDNLLNRDYYEPGSVVMLNQAGVPEFIREPGFTTVLGVDYRR